MNKNCLWPPSTKVLGWLQHHRSPNRRENGKDGARQRWQLLPYQWIKVQYLLQISWEHTITEPWLEPRTPPRTLQKASTSLGHFSFFRHFIFFLLLPAWALWADEFSNPQNEGFSKFSDILKFWGFAFVHTLLCFLKRLLAWAILPYFSLWIIC